MSERDIFTAARELTDPVARAAYLDGACGGDAGLRSRVEALLRAHNQPDSLLDHPAVAPPAPAEHLEHFVVAEAAQRVGSGGRGQERQRLVVGRRAALAADRTGGPGVVVVRGDRRVIEEAVRLVVGAEQRLDPRP